MRDALRGQGIDPRQFAWGEVYWFPDAELRFPATPAPKRVVKPQRPVVVLHNETLSRQPTYPTVLVAPISSRKDLRAPGALDLDVPSGEAGLPLPSIVHLGLIQPVLKVRMGGRLGQFSDQYCQHLEDSLLNAVLRAPPEEEEEICEAEYDPFAEE